MCGISGIISLNGERLPELKSSLTVMNRLQRHRGPDGEGMWVHPRRVAGLGHRRLAVIDIEGGGQPMRLPSGVTATYNGEIYNYLEVRRELGEKDFSTDSDTEVLLRAYERWGLECLEKLNGMFAFALWDETKQRLFCARDRLGLKPMHYAVVGDRLYLASEAKALLPFLDSVEPNPEAVADYLVFQLCLHGKTMFQNVHELQPGHALEVKNGSLRVFKYWEAVFEPDFESPEEHFVDSLRELLEDSVSAQMRSDVPVGAYLSGGLDSGATASLAKKSGDDVLTFTGKFSACGPDFDESGYARQIANWLDVKLLEVDIAPDDFLDHFNDLVYHMDFPSAGPGSFSQFVVSKEAAKHRKVVLGGQGGDEIFGGYARYLIAYFEQCIKAAIDDTMDDGNFIVTYKSILPNLTALAPYKPLLKEFFSEGMFEPLDKRYFKLINRAPHLDGLVHWDSLGDYEPFEAFSQVFNGRNVKKHASYFDKMTSFDFQTLLPALLHVEDRVSMAFGLESRAPLLDHRLVSKACTAPSNIKFKAGEMKRLFKEVAAPLLPKTILERKDKMGFPTPFALWLKDDIRDFVMDTLSSSQARSREFVDNRALCGKLTTEDRFGRTVWGLLNLEAWHQRFCDRGWEFRQLAQTTAPVDLDSAK